VKAKQAVENNKDIKLGSENLKHALNCENKKYEKVEN